MNEHQNIVVATVVCGLILIIVYLCPWHIESSSEIKWSPIYQQPITYERTYGGDYGRDGGSQLTSENAEIAYGILIIEIAVLLAVGGLLYLFFSDPAMEKEDLPEE
ncbi:hypothetical protein [Fodinibius sp.]|uniref:hypothetical protein n=1 Tax=Fodinibius sp. TaxID=1872440 RepID=UPI002ACD6FA7|nr:hypothetical protein [Fodinibius sp.]MDZ7660252.1 hypothetical protein [Fodinibius sp.]